MMYQRISQFDKKHFGTTAENHVASLIEKLSDMKCIKRHRRIFDLDWGGNRIEVKSAQLCRSRTAIKCRYNYHGFTTYRNQVLSMIKNNGFFALVLMIRDEPVAVRFVTAEEAREHLVRYGKGHKMRINLSVLYDGVSPDKFVEDHIIDRYMP